MTTWRLGSLFNYPTLFIGALMVLASLFVFLQSVIGAALLVIGGIAILTAGYGVQIDTEKRQFREFFSILGLKVGKWTTYDGMEKIFLNPATENQTIYSRANHGYNIKSQLILSFLKFEDGRKVALYKQKDKGKLLAKTQKMADHFRIPVQDNTA